MDLSKYDDKQVAALLSNRVYHACVELLEDLEHRGRIIGNGHHIAQNIALFAETELEKRFNKINEQPIKT